MNKEVKKTAEPTLEVWRTVELGFWSSVENIKNNLKRYDINIVGAEDILNSKYFKISEKKEKLDLFKVPLHLLFGIFPKDKGVSFQQIRERAKQFGLEICPDEVGPLARLKALGKDTDDTLFLAMEPYLNKQDDPCIFIIDRLWFKEGTKEVLTSIKISPTYPDYSIFIFCRHK